MAEDYWGDGYWGDGYWGNGYWGQGGTGAPIVTVTPSIIGPTRRVRRPKLAEPFPLSAEEIAALVTVIRRRRNEGNN